MKFPMFQGVELTSDFLLGLLAGYSFKEPIRKLVSRWLGDKTATSDKPKD